MYPLGCEVSTPTNAYVINKHERYWFQHVIQAYFRLLRVAPWKAHCSRKQGNEIENAQVEV